MQPAIADPLFTMVSLKDFYVRITLVKCVITNSKYVNTLIHLKKTLS
jgi:hypothetical protein